MFLKHRENSVCVCVCLCVCVLAHGCADTFRIETILVGTLDTNDGLEVEACLRLGLD